MSSENTITHPTMYPAATMTCILITGSPQMGYLSTSTHPKNTNGATNMVNITLDDRYMSLARDTSSISSCNKKQLGCVLVSLNNTSITGWNGPPEHMEQCNPCPRLDSPSSTDLHNCRAVHAEQRAILRAGLMNVSIIGATMYCYFGVPCKDCLLSLIESGISEIVCINDNYYDELSKSILQEWINNGGKFRIHKSQGD